MKFKAPMLASCVAALAFASLPAAVSADQGGLTIASAPEVPLGQSVTSTGAATIASACTTHGRSGEFWRVSMGAFDRLSVDFASTNGDLVGINMLAPTVTDATLADAETTGGCLDLVTSSSNDHYQFTAGGAGRYTLLVTDRQGSNTLSYQFVAHLLHATQLAITTPSRVKAGATLTLNGRVTGASGGSVSLQLRAGTAVPWKKLAPVSLSATGTFTVKTRVARPGTYGVRATYSGDDSHLPSSATATFKVTR